MSAGLGDLISSESRRAQCPPAARQGSISFRIRLFLLLLRIGLFLFGFFFLLAASRCLAVSRWGRNDLLFEWVDPGIAPGWAGILNVLGRIDLRIPLFVFHDTAFITHCKCRARGRHFALGNC
jgi:hypothetical protein